MGGWLGGCICGKKVKNRIKMVIIWVFTAKFFQRCCMFEIFYNNFNFRLIEN